jgi:hypothetical protein
VIWSYAFSPYNNALVSCWREAISLPDHAWEVDRQANMAADSRAIDMDASEEIETKRDALPHQATRFRIPTTPVLVLPANRLRHLRW